MKHYKNHEFCKSINCPYIDKKINYCSVVHCKFSAKDFHDWLNKNGYSIVQLEGGVVDRDKKETID